MTKTTFSAAAILLLAASPAFAAPVGAVPEPATWATMIAGFLMVGSAIRRARTATAIKPTL